MARQQKIKLRNGEEITLSEKELMFCEYYLGDANKNGTQAAKLAGYSQKTANEISTQNLAKLHIQKFLKDKTAPLLEALGITHERILRERSALAFTNLTDFVNDDWSLKKKSEINPIFYPALNQLSIKEKVLMQQGEEEGGGMVLSREITFKTADKDKSLAMLEKATGLVKEEPPAPVVPQGGNLFLQVNNYINQEK